MTKKPESPNKINDKEKPASNNKPQKIQTRQKHPEAIYTSRSISKIA